MERLGRSRIILVVLVASAGIGSYWNSLKGEQRRAIDAIEAFERERTRAADVLAQEMVANAKTRVSPHTSFLLNSFYIAVKRYQGTAVDTRFKESCRKEVRLATSIWSIDGHGMHSCEVELDAWSQRQQTIIDRKDPAYGRDIVIPDR